MNKGQYSNIVEESNKDDLADEDLDSSDNEYMFTFPQHDFMCAIQDKAVIPKTWILLDSQSTIDVLSNAKLLTPICVAKRNLILYCNAGKAIISKKVT